MDDPVHLHALPALRNAPLVLAFEGWNDAGEAATLAARYLADAVHAVPLAAIDGERFYDLTVRRPTVRLGPDGVRQIDWPRIRFSYGAVDSTREIVVGCGPEPHVEWRHFCDHVTGLLRRLKVRRAVLLGAFLADVVYSRPVDVTGFASQPALLDALDVASTRYEGPTGITGVLADWLRREGIEVVSLWAALPHYISASPNPRGALALVQKLTDCLAVKIDLEPLRLQAAAFEQKINDVVAADPDLTEYVRQLKRREFAQ